MTEHDKTTETVTPETGAKQQHSEKKTSSEQKRSGLIGGVIAIAIIIAIGGGLYYFTQQNNATLVNENNELKQQLSDLIEQQNSDRQRLDALITANTEMKNQSREYEDRLNRRMQELQAHVTALSSSDVKSWLIAQADFMVKMAGRKLWNDHDPVTAAVLLKSADSSLAEMNDPSLLDIRKSINNDMAKLAAINQVDYDGIILRLNQLSNDVDNLRLADLNSGDAKNEDNAEVSDDISDWQQNLSRSWKSFTNDFITVRARDGSEAPLLAPNQDIYLRENIRSQLLIAAQAVPRFQEETYKQSLEQASTWVRAYFDTEAPETKAFLSTIDELINQPIDVEMPDALESQEKLEKVMQTRVRSLLAQSSDNTKANDGAVDAAADAAVPATETQKAEPADTPRPFESTEPAGNRG
ncbi:MULTISPECIES: uroporphyrinogen-III C-methyltransferase [Providencia]|uniref:uroporphyrinogen-III C-methyltransferase n=1 Tax=Providencia TaxID=586 RepID=UPI001419A83B|nr:MULTISPECIES: uroporphyrinogen-III C-methyltransferase [Providencia]ELR5148700.1 uroporphyrinogen-III C-methyltransferase [Providencia rettgeri]NIA43693.1 uroporphyrinogen-III C-methyltransferase [Providencia rettgeri]NIA97406.1 uroporphyrinogen-III C-methyltransferase [Providencia rettgeri]NIB15062.1 uroporphyrinogen-III C-methyltransferase [Providencia rettgeri]NIB35390.1 uroporphyrinogen-III C-methyltransferase [Providencia rettgeri]